MNMVYAEERARLTKRLAWGAYLASSELLVPAVVGIAYTIYAAKKVPSEKPSFFRDHLPWFHSGVGLGLLVIVGVAAAAFIMPRYFKPVIERLIAGEPTGDPRGMSSDQLLRRAGRVALLSNLTFWFAWEIWWRSVLASGGGSGPPLPPEVPSAIGLIAAFHGYTRFCSYRVGWRLLTGGAPPPPSERTWSDRIAPLHGLSRSFPVTVAVAYGLWLSWQLPEYRSAPGGLGAPVPVLLILGLVTILLIEILGRWFNDLFLVELATRVLARASVTAPPREEDSAASSGLRRLALKIPEALRPRALARVTFRVLFDGQAIPTALLIRVAKVEQQFAAVGVMLIRDRLDGVDATLRSLPPSSEIDTATASLKAALGEVDVLERMHRRVYEDMIELQRLPRWREREESIDLGELVAAETARRRDAIVHGVQPPVRIHANRAAIAKALRALLENAEMANDRLRSDSSYPATPLSIDVRIEPDPVGRRVAVHVTDQGLSLPREVRSRLFEPGNTGHSRPLRRGDRVIGMGMGLFWVAQVARAHGGHVRIDDGPGGRGTVATIELPWGRIA